MRIEEKTVNGYRYIKKNQDDKRKYLWINKNFLGDTFIIPTVHVDGSLKTMTDAVSGQGQLNEEASIDR